MGDKGVSGLPTFKPRIVKVRSPDSNLGCFSWPWIMSRTLGWVFESTSQSRSHREKEREGGVDMAPAWESILELKLENGCVLPGGECAERAPLGSVHTWWASSRSSRSTLGWQRELQGGEHGLPRTPSNQAAAAAGICCESKTLPSLNTR